MTIVSFGTNKTFTHRTLVGPFNNGSRGILQEMWLQPMRSGEQSPIAHCFFIRIYDYNFPQIVNIGSNSKLFSSPRLEKLLDAAVCSTPFKLEADCEGNPSKAQQILPLKPPPTAPPPPPQTNAIKICSHVPQVFMSKMLLK